MPRGFKKHNLAVEPCAGVEFFSADTDFSAELVEGCGITLEELMAHDIVPPKNEAKDYSGVHARPSSSRKRTSFLHSPSQYDFCVDILVDTRLFAEHYFCEESCIALLRTDPNFSKLKYFPFLQWINVYENTTFKHSVPVVNIRERCCVCNKMEVDYEGALKMCESVCTSPQFDSLKNFLRAKSASPFQCRLRTCAECKVPWYCSRECQKKHWREHKASCRSNS